MFSKPTVALFTLSLLALSKQAIARPLRIYPTPAPRAYDLNARGDTSTCAIVTVTVDETSGAATAVASSTLTASAVSASTTTTTSQIGDFGSCSVPEIEFGTGFDGRKETSFQPVNQTSYDHGSAQNIAIITQFMCDALTNTCGANELAKTTCASAAAAASSAPSGSGAQADAFNAVFGITTDFAAIPEVSDQGVTLTSTATAAAASASSATSTTVTNVAIVSTTDSDTATCAVPTVTVTVTATVSVNVAAASSVAATTSAATSALTNVAAVSASSTATSSAAAASSTLSASQIGDFGSCSIPEIEFGTGFDGRTETAFQPVNQTSYNHGSADAIAVITSFMCDALTNTCGANALAKSTCATAAEAASSAAAGTGAQADAFNAVFGITTDFASVPEVSNTGVTISASAGTSTAAAASMSSTAAAAADAATTSASATATTTASAASSSSTSTAAQIGDFGSCSVPEIEFGDGFDGRTETSFRPADLSSYNHGSADGIAVITSFICQQVDDACGANDLAKTTCQTAASAASSAAVGTGAQADAFNAVFGIATDFAAVPEINDQGQTVTATATASA
ncbi:uncharacterized protein LAESUDRAFT_762180 [Laetiporus sulphureus 93-53]|uniref:Uncharacterized protein n=1 Tax=Laetiporus sulphureus 93-53 TaxID=1314785 RepID=A0A165CPT7_9APHY|nr:uncharacterized protein LAESUDRAFT_762180 [Laetiporus sulphureus 93-53]KZT03200.1 hypothetical protein LAESUDRAFT_762180 [Laetiporus sulphureus 93-53]